MYADATHCLNQIVLAAERSWHRFRPRPGSPRSGGSFTSLAPAVGAGWGGAGGAAPGGGGAVAGTEGEADQPSRFITELGVTLRELPGRPRRPLTLAALVAELRSITVNPEASPGLREEGAVRLPRA